MGSAARPAAGLAAECATATSYRRNALLSINAGVRHGRPGQSNLKKRRRLLILILSHLYHLIIRVRISISVYSLTSHIQFPIKTDMATGFEPIGGAFAVAGLLAAFKGAVDGYLMIESFFDRDDKNKYLTLRYHIEQHKLAIWGDYFKMTSPNSCTLTKQPDIVKNYVVQILAQVKNTHEEADVIVKKHGLSLPDVGPGDLDKNLVMDSQMVKATARLGLSKISKGRVRWHVKNRDKFTTLVDKLQQLNRDLYDILPPADVDTLKKMLSSYVLARIYGTEYVKMLQNPGTQSPSLLALSGKLMTLQKLDAGAVKRNIVPIHKNQLSLQSEDWTTGIYQAPTGLTNPVWIEWNTLQRGVPSYPTLRERIESLAVMLQAVDEPDLCIPPCCGIYDDLDFEAANGMKRLGTVFTVPSGTDYEADLRKFEPVTLKQLMRSSRNDPPLLGDRFKLAYKLASAFSLFHAAGWLHKGFRSENIVFLHRRAGNGLLITEPFIMGFQASRKQDTNSLPQQASRDPEVEYYYHAEAENGFTKRLDIYGLGVVLCEIGRWELLVDAFPATKKDKLKSRKWATKFLTESPLRELGWRVGGIYMEVVRTLLMQDLSDDTDKIFAHEFFTKVILPLDTCIA